ncbi:solute carrier family 22 member 4-like [Ctenocephalides felis]|uniref:solute carrier family 22 member 4-like n=1 Tax=Ctenocephalides felis TaxID=7515 RepID=UPI000E6E2013|nr:solute carrier family 22 member 4-like [Ctenocephalides felis]
MEKKDAIFDRVLDSIGSDGKFQHRFNYLYNVFFAVVAAMPCMNIILAMSVPDHWCHVPGRENTNYTLEEWKRLTLPVSVDTRGLETLSSCEMYNASDWTDSSEVQNSPITECQHGYEYDKTWFDLTVTSQEDWVCDKELRVTNTFVIARIGEMIGAFVFGQLGDTLGRRPVFYMSLVLIITGKVINLFLTRWYSWYSFGALIGALTQMPLFQTVMVIGMEISKSEDNSHIAMLQNVGWTVGICLMPLVMWWLRNWFYFVIATSLPFAMFLISNKYMIESPRWLASRGKMVQCEKMLRRIAKVNGTTLNDDALEMLKIHSSNPEKIYGVMSLFSSWRLARNTIMIVTCWIVGGLSYFLLILNVNNMDGNPFLNYLYQGLVEMPAYIFGKWATNNIGRRWTAVMAFSVAFIVSLPLLHTTLDPELHIYTSVLTVLIKFCISTSFYVMMVQGVEIYPTCLRQTGIALGVLSGNALGVVGPYVVYLGTAYDARYPYLILSLLMLIGLTAQLLSPETLHQKLPETLADAQVFGSDQKFWALPKKNNHDILLQDEKMKISYP